MKKGLLVLGMAALTLTGCGKTVPKLENGKEVVASIDGFNVTAEDLYEELKNQNGISIVVDKIDNAITEKIIKDSKEANEYADKQIDAIKAQYEAYGMKLDDVLQQYGYENEAALRKEIVTGYNKDLALKSYLTEKLTEEEVNKYYEEEIYGEMTVRHILIKPVVSNDMTSDEKAEAEEAAKEKAQSLIDELDNGADFETLAKENSDDAGTASQGGLFANFTKDGTVSEFFEASLKLNNNEYTTTPVKTTYGYHVILKISQNDKPKLEDVIDDIKEKIVENNLKEDQNLSIVAWDELRDKYNLSINDSTLEEKYNAVMDSYKKNA